MTRMYTIMLVSCITLLSATSGMIATQETATASAPTETTTAVTPTTASESSNKTTYYGGVADDRAVRIISAEYVDGIAVLVLESDLPRTVTATAPTGSTLTSAAAGNLVRRPAPPRRITTRTDSPESRVTFVTSYSVKNDQYTEIRFDDGGSTLIADPFTGTDVRDAAIGGILDTSFGVLLIIVQWRFGLHRDIEHIV